MANKEHLPDSLFDWLESYSFRELGDQEKNNVLDLMSAEEYNDLHESVVAVRTASTLRPKSRKEDLLQRFDRKHKKSFHVPVYIWKLAAVLLLLLAAGQFYYSSQLRHELASVLPLPADTVYLAEKPLTKEVKIVDTVYVPVTVKKRSALERSGTQRSTEEIPVPTRMNVLSVQDIESGPNKPKGNSLEQDSMMRKFTFVTM